jgi:hypothetical protein
MSKEWHDKHLEKLMKQMKADERRWWFKYHEDMFAILWAVIIFFESYWALEYTSYVAVAFIALTILAGVCFAVYISKED